MENTHLNLVHDEEETMATPRFVAPADTPKRVVPLERIRARTASAVKRVRHRIQPASQPSRSNWLPILALVLLAGVAGGFFLATGKTPETAEDAPIVRSELEAKTDNLNIQAQKSAFVEKEKQAADSTDSADFAPGETSSADAESESEPEPETPSNKLLTVEDKPQISTKVELRNDENPAQQAAPSSENERLELIRKDAERQAARERAERKRREQKSDENQTEKPEGEEPNEKQEQSDNSDSEESTNTDQF